MKKNAIRDKLKEKIVRITKNPDLRKAIYRKVREYPESVQENFLFFMEECEAIIRHPLQVHCHIADMPDEDPKSWITFSIPEDTFLSVNRFWLQSFLRDMQGSYKVPPIVYFHIDNFNSDFLPKSKRILTRCFLSDFLNAL
jgi:hypothetical protein